MVVLKLFPSTMNRLCSTPWGKEDSLERSAWSSAVQEQLLSGKMVRHTKKNPLPLRDSELFSSVVVKLSRNGQNKIYSSKGPSLC